MCVRVCVCVYLWVVYILNNRSRCNIHTNIAFQENRNPFRTQYHIHMGSQCNRYMS